LEVGDPSYKHYRLRSLERIGIQCPQSLSSP